MIRGSFWAFCVACIGLAGCEGPISNCVVEIEGVDACIPVMSSTHFCRTVWGGEPTAADRSDCESLGYPTRCSGSVNNEGDGSTATINSFFAEDEAACESLDGATFHDRE